MRPLRYLRQRRRAASVSLRRQFQKHRPYTELNAKAAEGKGSRPDDRRIIERLVRAYQRSAETDFYGADSMWREFFEKHHAEQHAAFIAGDIEKSGQILANPRESKLFWGYDELVDDYYKSFAANDAVRKDAALVCQDYFLRLAEAIGVHGVDNPESNVWLSRTKTSADSILAEVEEYLGIEIIEPDVYAGRFGLKTRKGVLSYRSVQSVYLAHRLATLLHDAAPDRRRICEIGAGLGRPALYARRLGLKDYSIVDLPFTSISQGYYLMRCLGEDAVVLPGESRDGAEDRIKLLHPDEFFAEQGGYDIIVNVDSLTELGEKLATDYLTKIVSLTSTLLSINHEVNPIRAFKLLQQLDRPPRVMRYPYWMRPGYVEELARWS